MRRLLPVLALLLAGAAQAGLMLAGEWWRAVTALTLHVSSTHLLGNLVFGTVFFFLLAQMTGSGLAWLTMLLGCASTSNAPPRIETTRLRSSDLRQMTDQMAASLIASDALQPGMIIVV